MAEGGTGGCVEVRGGRAAGRDRGEVGGGTGRGEGEGERGECVIFRAGEVVVRVCAGAGILVDILRCASHAEFGVRVCAMRLTMAQKGVFVGEPCEMCNPHRFEHVQIPPDAPCNHDATRARVHAETGRTVRLGLAVST